MKFMNKFDHFNSFLFFLLVTSSTKYPVIQEGHS